MRDLLRATIDTRLYIYYENVSTSIVKGNKRIFILTLIIIKNIYENNKTIGYYNIIIEQTIGIIIL